MKIRHVTLADLEDVYRIEKANFLETEAASYQTFKERILKIPDTFLIAEINGEVAGYIDGQAVNTRHLTDDLFTKVVKNAKTGGYIAVTSLSVDEKFQGQSVGRQLISALKDVAYEQQREGICLTCHNYLIKYYEKNWFINEGRSKSVHGGAIWYDMVWENPEI